MSCGDFLEYTLLNLLYGNEAFTPPDVLYMGLSLTDPSDDGGGITEPVGGAYERIAITNDTTTWADAAGSQKKIQIDLDWAPATAAWGTPLYAFLSTAASGGTFYGAWALSPARYIDTESRFSIKANKFTITMAGDSSEYTRHKLLDHTFGKTTYTPPANIFLGLSQTDPKVSITEPIGANYERVSIANNITNFPTATDHVKNNGVAFTSPTASGLWGTIGYHFTGDAASGGNLLHSAALDTVLYPSANNYVEWAIGNFEVQQT